MSQRPTQPSCTPGSEGTPLPSTPHHATRLLAHIAARLMVGLVVGFTLGLPACRTDACTNPDIALPIPITVRLEVYQRLVPDGAAPSSSACTTLCQAFEPAMIVVDSCKAGEPSFPDGGPDTASATGIATIPVSCWGRFPCPEDSP